MKKLVCGQGLYEVGKYPANDGEKATREYECWGGMLERCYSTKLHIKRPTYVGCTASDNFKRFQYFAEWCQDQVGFENKGWQLDKDILITGNKLYSENTCVFVPREINNFLLSHKSIRGEYPKGVAFSKFHNKLQAYYTFRGKPVHLGYFTNVEDAKEAYKEAKELRAKQLAAETMGLVDVRVTDALNNFVVNFNN